MRFILVELRRILKSPLYGFTFLIFAFFVASQMGTDASQFSINPPTPGGNYGQMASQDFNVIRRGALSDLLHSYRVNHYVTYPFGFYRSKSLGVQKQKEMSRLLSALTGSSVADIEMISKGKEKGSVDETLQNALQYALSPEDFLAMMNRIDALLGGGSSYHEKRIQSSFGYVPKDYETAMADHHKILEKDQITGALARLFCDYFGIIIFIGPGFFVTAYWLSDRKKGIDEILYTKDISSFRFVFSRMIALTLALWMFVLVIGTYYNGLFLWANSGQNPDGLRIYGTLFLWLFPALCVGVCFYSLFAILTGGPFGIIIGFILWFLGLQNGSGKIHGNYGLSLTFRHNIIGNTDYYYEHLNQIWYNRAFWMGIFFLGSIICVGIWQKKRGGKRAWKK